MKFLLIVLTIHLAADAIGKRKRKDILKSHEDSSAG